MLLYFILIITSRAASKGADCTVLTRHEASLFNFPFPEIIFAGKGFLAALQQVFGRITVGQQAHRKK